MTPAPLERARRRRNRALDPLQQADADIHLEELETVVHAPFEPLAHRPCRQRRCRYRCRSAPYRGTCRRPVDKRVGRKPCPPVEERHLDAADAAALPPVIAELLDLTEELVDIAGVLAEQARFEQQRVGRAGAITHFAVAADALIGVQAKQRDVERQRLEIDDAQVGDFQIGSGGSGC